MSFQYECEFHGISGWEVPDGIGAVHAAPGGYWMCAQVDRSTSANLVASILRSKLLEAKDLPTDSALAHDAIRDCAKAHADKWKDLPVNDRPEFIGRKLAWFHLTWKPTLEFQKVTQNRLYRILYGEKLIGALRRPGRDMNWHFFQPFVEGSAQGDWPNLKAAKIGVEPIVKELAA